MKVCATWGFSAAPPLMHRRSRPPRRSRSFEATSARSTGQRTNDARHGPRPWRHSKRFQPTWCAISKRRRFEAGAPSSWPWIAPCRRSKIRGTDTITVGRTDLKSSASCGIERAKATWAPATIVR